MLRQLQLRNLFLLIRRCAQLRGNIDRHIVFRCRFTSWPRRCVEIGPSTWARLESGTITTAPPRFLSGNAQRNGL